MKTVEQFKEIIADHICDENFYEIVAEVAGEPEDDGESEWSLIERLSSLSIEKRELLLSKLDVL